MPLSFPSSPTVGQSSTQNGRTYVWSGAAWELASGSWAVANPVFTGTVTIPAGTAGSPALVSATGTADTGVYFPGADTVAIATAGLARLSIQSGGNIIVGPDSSATASSHGQLLRTTNAVGTDLAGADMRIQPGRGTGTGAGGTLRFLTTPAGATSGTALNLAVERMAITPAGNVGIGTSSPSVLLDVNGTSIRIASSSTPASASASGVAGEIRWDSSYVYVYVGTSWKRAALSAW